MDEILVEETTIQYLCRRCMGEVWLRVPFTPNFCSHCGVQLEFSGVTIQ